MAEKKFSQFTDGDESRVGDEVVGLRSGTNHRFDFPGAGIKDITGNELLYWTSSGAAAANYILVTSANASSNPSISSAGSDASPGLLLTTQGSGNLILDPAGTGVVSSLASIRMGNALGFQSGTTNGDTALLQAYNTGGASYTTFGTLASGATPSFDLTVTSLVLTTPLPVTSGGTGTATQFTAGSVVFAGALGVYGQDNANLFWDNTSNYLGIGTAVPAHPLEIKITNTASGASGFLCGIAESATGQIVYGNLVIITSSVARTTASSTFSYYSGISGNAGDTSSHISSDFYADDGDVTSASIKTSFFSGLNKAYLIQSGSGDILFTAYTPNIYSSTGDLQLAFDGAIGKGNVGVGKAPTTRLDVNGTTASTAIQSSQYLNSDAQNVLTFSNLFGTPVNYFNMAPVSTLNKPIFSVTGSDANIGMILSTAGTGTFQMVSANVAPIQFNCGTSSQHTANFQFADTATTQTIIFPDGNGTLAFTGGASFTWTTVAGTSQACAVDNGYVSGNAAQTTFTLPASMDVGEEVAIEGLGAAGWKLTANTGQTIKIGTSTTSSAGTLTSAAGSDNVYVVCIVQNTTWRVVTTNSTGLTIT